jgi:hypothetical protein
VVAVVLIFVFVEAYVFWWPAYLFNQKVDELKNDGVNVVELVYDEFHAQATSDSTDADFAKIADWGNFTQQILAIKAVNGTVTVWVDSTARNMWFLQNGTTATYYIYQA